ncbi:hypothetical protein [Penaeicola halotolerans]|uniref:hypothetical protein n=1 Tax=Penaeicola halotolerans TaxID=2793196 RepID=UPI001CF92ECD|nr:hypothetical protein [Penaeicola halotolerans]
MSKERIEELIDKYWAAESSLEEEQELRFWLAQDTSSNYRELKDLLGGFEALAQEQMPATSLLFATRQKPQRSPKYWMSVAASFLILIASGVGAWQYQRYMQVKQAEADQAYNDMIKVLSIMGEKLNKGKKEMAELAKFSQTQKILNEKEQ